MGQTYAQQKEAMQKNHNRLKNEERMKRNLKTFNRNSPNIQSGSREASVLEVFNMNHLIKQTPNLHQQNRPKSQEIKPKKGNFFWKKSCSNDVKQPHQK